MDNLENGKLLYELSPKEQVISAIRYREVIYLLNELFASRYAIVKGEPLSVQAFGGEGRRPLGDIDVLIEKEDVQKLKAVLLKEGYIPQNNERRDEITALLFSHQTSPFIKNGVWGKIEIDVNFEIVWGEFVIKPSVKKMLSERVPITIYGMRTFTLSPQNALIFGCLHLYKETNSVYHLSMHNPFKISRFLEIYYLWKNNKEIISIDEIRMWGIQHGLYEYIFLILYYVSIVAGDESLTMLLNFQEEQKCQTFGLGENKYEWPLSFEQRFTCDNLTDLVNSIISKKDKIRIEDERRIFKGEI